MWAEQDGRNALTIGADYAECTKRAPRITRIPVMQLRALSAGSVRTRGIREIRGDQARDERRHEYAGDDRRRPAQNEMGLVAAQRIAGGGDRRRPRMLLQGPGTGRRRRDLLQRRPQRVELPAQGREFLERVAAQGKLRIDGVAR